MRKELERALKAPQMWASFVVCLITLMGYSLAYWIGTILVGEWIEYRESAFHTILNLKTFDYPLTTSNAFDHICRQQTYGFA